MTEIIAVALNLAKWIWNHKALAALIIVSLYAWYLRGDNATLMIQRDAAVSRIEAAEQKEAMWKASHESAAAELKHVRTQLDSMDEKARKQQETWNQQVTELAKERDTALSRAEAFRTELERKANEPGATAASVGRAALEGLR